MAKQLSQQQQKQQQYQQQHHHKRQQKQQHKQQQQEKHDYLRVQLKSASTTKWNGSSLGAFRGKNALHTAAVRQVQNKYFSCSTRH